MEEKCLITNSTYRIVNNILIIIIQEFNIRYNKVLFNKYLTRGANNNP